MGRGSSKAGGGGGVKEGGGFRYTSNGTTFTMQRKGSDIYDVSDLADIPTKMNTNKTANEVVKSMRQRGYEVTVLSPAQMQQRVDARNAERQARANIDYELGMGVPWSNREYRKVARKNRLVTRMSKRKGK